jgi:hypothetical protein
VAEVRAPVAYEIDKMMDKVGVVWFSLENVSSRFKRQKTILKIELSYFIISNKLQTFLL